MPRGYLKSAVEIYSIKHGVAEVSYLFFISGSYPSAEHKSDREAI